MNLLEITKAFLTGKSIKNETPVGVCPNCWGNQEYADNYYKLVKKEGINLKNLSERRGWIQAYAAEKLASISLSKNEDLRSCITCNM